MLSQQPERCPNPNDPVRSNFHPRAKQRIYPAANYYGRILAVLLLKEGPCAWNAASRKLQNMNMRNLSLIVPSPTKLLLHKVSLRFSQIFPPPFFAQNTEVVEIYVLQKVESWLILPLHSGKTTLGQA